MFLSSHARPRLALTGSAVLLTLFLAGCASDDLAMDDTFVPYAPSERYPIKYAKAPVTLQVSPKHGTLQPNQVNAVASFARQSKAGGLTPILVKRPAGGGKSVRVAQEIAGLLEQEGVPAGMIQMGTYPAAASAPVQLSYVRAYAQTKPCGEWPENLADTHKNERFTNHGCAVQSNIAAMIANPQDLVQPRTQSMGAGSAAAESVRKVTNGQAPQPRSIFDIF